MESIIIPKSMEIITLGLFPLVTLLIMEPSAPHNAPSNQKNTRTHQMNAFLPRHHFPSLTTVEGHITLDRLLGVPCLSLEYH